MQIRNNDCQLEMNAVSFPRALWSGVFDPYVMAEQVFERQLVKSVLLCEPHVCELSPQGCSVFVPPSEGVGGGPKEKWLVGKKGFLTLPYLSLEMKNATRI